MLEIIDTTCLRILYLLIFTISVQYCGLNSISAQEATPQQYPAEQTESSLRPVVMVENALLKTLEATTISAEVSGRLSDWKVHEGQRVTKEQTLGKVNDRVAQLQLQQARTAMARARLKNQSDIELRLAESRTEVSKNELERAIQANARIADTFPLKEIDRLKLIHQTNLLEVERAKHEKQLGALDVTHAEDQYRAAAELVDRHQIRSPVDGVIVSVRRRLGEWVEPGAEVLQIVNLDRLRIEGFVSANSAMGIQIGTTAEVVLTVGNEKVVREAKVSFVGHEVNPSTGQIRIFLELPNADLSLKPGMRAEARISLGQAEK